MATLSQFFPGGSGDGQLVYSKQISWTQNTYMFLGSPQYIDSTYITLAAAPNSVGQSSMTFNVSGDYRVKMFGVSYGNSGLMQLDFTLRDSIGNNIRSRSETVGANTVWMYVSSTNDELLRGVVATNNMYGYFPTTGTFSNLNFQVYKK